jgi:hypothetical protein
MKFLMLLLLTACTSNVTPSPPPLHLIQNVPDLSQPVFNKNSWQYFLQHLPEKQGDILDYTGNPIRYQEKHFAIINYDVGTRDLQQCADALIRLRAEYLFEQKRYDEISFRFNSGEWFRYSEYLKGRRPAIIGNTIYAAQTDPVQVSHTTLRNFLDIVYAFTSTVALERDLKPAADFEIGTVVLHVGSPGHCFIIVDEMKNERGEKLFKLAEGYMPAQSIYILKNEDGTPWHRLSKKQITTASYDFTTFSLKKFE